MEADQKKDGRNDEPAPADFEKAMDAAGFGLFNFLLLSICTIAAFSTVFETSTMSYILPIAECDLEMTLFEKGSLNAATYAGMISSAIIWGYLADTLGRRKILLYGYLADAVCVISSSLTQNFKMLVAFKFVGGFIVNGPGAVLFTYLTEMHSAEHRPRVVMIIGMMNSIALLCLPLLAFAIFPRDWDFVIFDSLKVHSWQIFLAVCGLPSLLSGLCFILLPESPKFLMSQGRNGEALREFQKIYAINTKMPKASFPITELVEEVPSRYTNVNEHVFTVENTPVKPKFKRESRTFSQAFREGMQQIKPLFRKPLLGYAVHFFALQFCILLGMNTIRLWLPQLFAAITEYEALSTTEEGSGSLCTILEYSANKTMDIANVKDSCSNGRPNYSMELYINNIIVAGAGFVGYFFAGAIVRALGPKRLLTLGLSLSAFLAIGLYWSVNGLSTLIIASAFQTIVSVSTSCLLGVVIALIPTSLRSLVVAVAMMFGRMGALSGNILFPIFIEMGCIQPFLMVGVVLFVASALSSILPSTKGVALQ
ncbi:synaptic vesicle glycoprotein 2B-like [Eurosta solidaginis]|uniref:synaptic vesicle glycoprotein 2B-like n=1 Tax=Eurosta solidaginis TaxID=178769 RepID=UPI0035306DF5